MGKHVHLYNSTRDFNTDYNGIPATNYVCAFTAVDKWEVIPAEEAIDEYGVDADLVVVPSPDSVKGKKSWFRFELDESYDEDPNLCLFQCTQAGQLSPNNFYCTFPTPGGNHRSSANTLSPLVALEDEEYVYYQNDDADVSLKGQMYGSWASGHMGLLVTDVERYTGGGTPSKYSEPWLSYTTQDGKVNYNKKNN